MHYYFSNKKRFISLLFYKLNINKKLQVIKPVVFHLHKMLHTVKL
ncbi:hypothetical protein EZS27_011506 [termite gut metagenome]|uniref:Uncharacterized protein n=1 Tax=termite gut metagenome TaxID=433724 RepID=A0A5J4S5N5_9ZZZZ